MANTAFSDVTELNIVNHLFRATAWTKPAGVFLALHVAAPNDTLPTNEVSGGNYARIAVAQLDASWTITGKSISNAGIIAFNAPNAAWGTITHIGIYDALTGGNLLAWDTLTNSKIVGATDPAPSFAVGAFVFTYNSGSYDLAQKVLSYIFRSLTLASWPVTTSLTFDLYTAAPNSTVTGGGGTKVTGGSYAPASSVALTTNYPYTAAGSNGTTSVTNIATGENAGVLSYPTPTAAWGAVVAIGVFNNAGLFLGSSAFSAKNIGINDVITISAGSFTWAVN